AVGQYYGLRHIPFDRHMTWLVAKRRWVAGWADGHQYPHIEDAYAFERALKRRWVVEHRSHRDVHQRHSTPAYEAGQYRLVGKAVMAARPDELTVRDVASHPDLQLRRVGIDVQRVVGPAIGARREATH